MKSNNLIAGLLCILCLVLTNGITYKLSRDKAVKDVVDNMASMCYNGSGAVLETSNPEVFVLCKTVIVEQEPTPPQRNLQQRVDKAREA